VTDRQERISGFSQSALNAATGVLVGAGGICSEIGEGLVRKGVGRLRIFDHDVVELSNLNRQHFFKGDVGKSKSIRLARNLAHLGACGTMVEGYACSFQDALALGLAVSGSFVVCGVDNAATRVDVSRF